MASTASDEAQLARQLKHFRKQFRQEHGCDPSRKDMARQPHIAAVYKAWLACKDRGVGDDGPSTSNTATAAQSEAKAPAKSMASGDTRFGSSTSTSLGNADANSTTSRTVHSPLRRRMKQRQREEQGRQTTGSQSMAAPPSTPGKRKEVGGGHLGQRPKAAMVGTPQRTPGRTAEMNASIEDSGGSIIDVPMTPQQQKRRRARMESAASPSQVNRRSHMSTQLQPGRSNIANNTHGQLHEAGMDYDDATSPSKLRALIASFTATRSRLTPTKMRAAAHRAARFADEGSDGESSSESSDKDAAADKATSPAAAKDTSLKNRLQASRMAYTPRTKARKRLRGEVIVTPGKTPRRIAAAVPQSEMERTPGKVRLPHGADEHRPVKRQRGMGSLQSFGFTAARGGGTAERGDAAALSQLIGKTGGPLPSQGHMPVAAHSSASQTPDLDEDDDEDDDEIMGPSPSVRKIVDVSGTVFQPLLGPERLAEGEQDQVSAPAAEQSSVRLSETGHEVLGVPLNEGRETEEDASDDELEFVRPYERYDRSMQRVSSFKMPEGEEDDEVPMPFLSSHKDLPSDIVNDTQGEIEHMETGSPYHYEPSSTLFGDMTLTSPQCKRARQVQRNRAAQKVRALLALDTNALDATAREAGADNVYDRGELSTTASGQTAERAARTTAKMLSAPRKRGVHAGRAKAAVATAAQEAMATDGAPAEGQVQASAKPQLILRRGREDNVDSDDDDGISTASSLLDDDEDEDLGRPKRRDAARVHIDDDATDEHWASDVGSDEYGLGDGVMDDYDVM